MKPVGAMLAWFLAGLTAAIAGPPYPLTKWTTKIEPGLRVCFKRETGREPAAVTWHRGWYSASEGDPPAEIVDRAFVRSVIKSTGSRLGSGVILCVWKSPNRGMLRVGGAYHWEAADQPGSSWKYVMIAPGVDEFHSPRNAKISNRIYNQPISVSPSLDDATIIALTDAFWRLAANEFSGDRLSFDGRDFSLTLPLKSPDGVPTWKNLSRIERVSEVRPKGFVEGENFKPDDFALTLSQGGDGCMLIILRRIDHGFRIVGDLGVDF